MYDYKNRANSCCGHTVLKPDLGNCLVCDFLKEEPSFSSLFQHVSVNHCSFAQATVLRFVRVFFLNQLKIYSSCKLGFRSCQIGQMKSSVLNHCLSGDRFFGLRNGHEKQILLLH